MQYRIVPLCAEGLALSISGDDSDRRLYVYGQAEGNERQLWLPELWFDANSQLVGTLLINKYSGNVALSQTEGGDNAYVTQLDLPIAVAPSTVGRVTWDFKGYDGKATAIRPTGDSTQNLNVKKGKSGCSPGDPVITFGWGGGQGNEIWQLVPDFDE